MPPFAVCRTFSILIFVYFIIQSVLLFDTSMPVAYNIYRKCAADRRLAANLDLVKINRHKLARAVAVYLFLCE